MQFKLITDSASDLPKQIQQQYGIEVIPTPVVIDENDFLDGETIQPKEFYTILRANKSDIKTYHINSYMFREHFEPYAKRKEELVYICFSTGIAGTFNAANIAKQELLDDYPDFNLTIIDGRCASMGFGLLVYYAARMQANGASKEKVIEGIEWHREHMEHLFTVETLDYLYKGGRLSRSSAIAGGLLDIKPIIRVNENGALEPCEKVRTRNKSLRRLIELVGEKGADLSEQTIGIVHGDCPDVLEEIKKTLQDKYGCKHFIENYVGCAIGAHTGPGIIGITFLNEESPYKI